MVQITKGRGCIMATLVKTFLEGISADDYDKVQNLVIESGTPAGLLLHSAGPVSNGWLVVDVWETKAQFETFAGTVLGPKLASVGITVKPDQSFTELYNLWTPGVETLGTIGADPRPLVHA